MSMTRLVSVPETVPPPLASLQALRELAPRLELVCLLPNVWWIGEVKDSSAAFHVGQAKLRAIRQKLARGGYVRPISLFKAQLQSQGFQMLAMVRASEPTPTQCVMAVAPTLRVTDKQIDDAFLGVLRERVERKQAVTKWIREEYAPYQGRDAHRHAFHRPIISIGSGT